jgi:hypothetical protein
VRLSPNNLLNIFSIFAKTKRIMEVPKEFQGKYCYHFTHKDNLKSILKNGLLCTTQKEKLDLSHTNIANEGIQNRRSTMKVTCDPLGVVHDYVPFYLCSVNPMMLSIVRSKNIDQQDLIILVVSLEDAFKNNAVFTNASANTKIPPSFYNNPEDLSKLDWPAINKTKWGSKDDDERHNRMAEVLFHTTVPVQLINNIIVWNKAIKKFVTDTYIEQKIKLPSISHEPFNGRNFYFTKFQVGKPLESLITGPKTLKAEYREAIKIIYAQRKEKLDSYSFKNIEDALLGIREDFCCIKELKGIFNLATRNEFHKENVSDHTKKVVQNLTLSDAFSDFEEEDQNILELSAYLHDIGKGPKSKWRDGIQDVYPDHPADALEMLVRILVKEIKTISKYEIEMICLLVAYHDLIGEIIGQGRNIDQLFDVVDTEEEFDMLSALNYADVLAINSSWADQYYDEIDEIREQFVDQL